MAIAIHEKIMNFSYIFSENFLRRQQQLSGLPGAGIVTEADADSTGFQGPGTFMGQGRAMQACTDGDPLLCQLLCRLLAIHFRNKRYCPQLIFPAKHPKSQVFKALCAAFRLQLRSAPEPVDPRTFQVFQPRTQACDAGNI